MVRIIVLVVGLVIVAAAWGGSRRNGESNSASRPTIVTSGWYLVEPRSFDLAVVASGELESKSKVEIRSKVEGTTTIVEVIDQGKVVQEGDVLVRMANDQIKEKIVQEQLQVEQALADMVAAEQNLAIEENDAENNVRVAQLKIELAQLDLEKWQSGDDPQKKQDLKLELDRATRKLDRSKRNYKASQQLHKEQFISQGELEDDELAVTEAKAALDKAQLGQKVYEQYTRPKEFKQVQSDLDQTKAELERVKRKNTSKLAQVQANLKGKQRTLKLREDRLAKHEQQLVYSIIVAPKAGEVVYATTLGRHRRSTGETLAQGKQVRFNELLIILPDRRNMVAKIKVHEAMVAQVKKDQDVSITIDARPDMPIIGKVASVGVMAESGGWLNPDLREYMVTVNLPKQQASGDLKPAMRCTGRIVTGKVDQSLALPIQAVHAQGRKHYCYVRTADGLAQKQSIKIGRSGESYVEIIKGLEKGSQVLLRQPKPQEMMASATAIDDDADDADENQAKSSERPMHQGMQGDRGNRGNGENSGNQERRGQRGIPGGRPGNKAATSGRPQGKGRGDRPKRKREEAQGRPQT